MSHETSPDAAPANGPTVTLTRVLADNVRPHVGKPWHHEYSRQTPIPIIATFVGAISLLITGLAFAIATGHVRADQLGSVMLFTALAAIATSLPIRMHDQSWITFTELFLVVTFIQLPVVDSAIVICLVALWTIVYYPTSWMGAASHAGASLLEAVGGLAATVAVGAGLGAMGTPYSLVVVAQVLVGTCALNFGFLVSSIPYFLFASRELRAILNPFGVREMFAATRTALVALAPTSVLAVFAVQQSVWLASLALVPLVHSWWAVERSVQLADAQRRASTDPLTRLLNRHGLQQALSLRLAADTTDVTFILGDIDDFKQVNDRLGHAAGDEVLRTVAAIIEAACARSSCVSARYGGEEFVVIHFGRDLPEVVAWSEQLRVDVREALQGVGSGISLGVSAWRGGFDSVDAALERADIAMYAAKTNGRNQVFLNVDDDRLPHPAFDSIDATELAA